MKQIINRLYTRRLKKLTPELHVKRLVGYAGTLLALTLLLHLGSTVCAAPVSEKLQETVNNIVNDTGPEKLVIPAVSASSGNPSVDKTVYHFNVGVFYQKLGNIENAI